jgi:hypothetical protein
VIGDADVKSSVGGCQIYNRRGADGAGWGSGMSGNAGFSRGVAAALGVWHTVRNACMRRPGCAESAPASRIPTTGK